MSTGVETQRVLERDRTLYLHATHINGWFTPNEAALAVNDRYPLRNGNISVWFPAALSLVLRRAARRGELEKRPNPNDGRSVQYRWID